MFTVQPLLKIFSLHNEAFECDLLHKSIKSVVYACAYQSLKTYRYWRKYRLLPSLTITIYVKPSEGGTQSVDFTK